MNIILFINSTNSVFFLHPNGVFSCMHPTLETSEVSKRLSMPEGVAAHVLEALHCSRSLVHL